MSPAKATALWWFACTAAVLFWLVVGVASQDGCADTGKTDSLGRAQSDDLVSIMSGTVQADRIGNLRAWSENGCQAVVRSGFSFAH